MYVKGIDIWVVDEETHEIYQKIHYSYPEEYLSEDNVVYMDEKLLTYSDAEDINGDGHFDIYVYKTSDQFTQNSMAFIWDVEKQRFVYDPSFEEISYPAVPWEEKGAVFGKVLGENIRYYKYMYEDGRFNCIGELYETKETAEDGATGKNIYYEIRYENGEIVYRQDGVSVQQIDPTYWYDRWKSLVFTGDPIAVD